MLVFAAVALATGCNAPSAPASTQAAQAPLRSADVSSASRHSNQRSEPRWHTKAGLRMLEVEVGGRDARLPMVVIIHGLGDQAHAGWINDFDAPARYVFPQAPVPHGDGFSWFSFGAREGAGRLATDIAAAGDQLAMGIAQLAAERPTTGRPVVAGFSQGAMLTFALALNHPTQVAFAVPLAGLLPEALYRDVPRPGVHYPKIVALHGTADERVAFETTHQMVRLLHDRGLDITLTSYDGVSHAISTAMRARFHALLREAIAEQVSEAAANGGNHGR